MFHTLISYCDPNQNLKVWGVWGIGFFWGLADMAGDFFWWKSLPPILIGVAAIATVISNHILGLRRLEVEEKWRGGLGGTLPPHDEAKQVIH
jgi:hypothetical protein